MLILKNIYLFDRLFVCLGTVTAKRKQSDCFGKLYEVFLPD